MFLHGNDVFSFFLVTKHGEEVVNKCNWKWTMFNGGIMFITVNKFKEEHTLQ